MWQNTVKQKEEDISFIEKYKKSTLVLLTTGLYCYEYLRVSSTNIDILALGI